MLLPRSLDGTAEMLYGNPRLFCLVLAADQVSCSRSCWCGRYHAAAAHSTELEGHYREFARA